MKTTKITMLILVIFAAITTSFAQTSKSTMQLLTATEWEYEHERNDKKMFTKFSEYKQSYEVMSNVKTISWDAEYYLSDVIPENFEKEKVGKIKNGKYIIAKEKEDFYILEIIKLTDKELALQQKVRPGERGLSGGPLVYKPVVR